MVRCIASPRNRCYVVDAVEVAEQTSFAVLDDGRKVPAFALSAAWARVLSDCSGTRRLRRRDYMRRYWTTVLKGRRAEMREQAAARDGDLVFSSCGYGMQPSESGLCPECEREAMR
jgi:hypothetical protein